MSKVSICIPSYNQATIMRKCLDSIVEQTYRDFELIVSDDSTNNEIRLLVDEYKLKLKDINISYVHHEPALGSPSNWNHTLSMAKGEYIKIMHHDDFFTKKESLDSLVKLLDQNSSAGMAFCASVVWNVPGNSKRIHSCSDKQFQRLKTDPEFLFFKNVIGSPSAVIFRNNSQIFDNQLKWLVDVDFYIRLLKSNPNIVMTNEALVCTADGAAGQVTQSVVHDKSIQIREHVLVFEKLNPAQLNNERYIRFWDKLFSDYHIADFTRLNSIVPVSKALQIFFNTVFDRMKDKRLSRKLSHWFYGSRLNNYFFKKEEY